MKILFCIQFLFSIPRFAGNTRKHTEADRIIQKHTEAHRNTQIDRQRHTQMQRHKHNCKPH